MKHPKCLEFKTLCGTQNNFFGNLQKKIRFGQFIWFDWIDKLGWAGRYFYDFTY